MNYREALAYAMDLCSRQERCRSEISEKLESRNIAAGDIMKILEALEKENFIDEARYAGTYTRDKLRFNKWGKVRIRYMLERKKIPDTLIARALDEIDHEHYAQLLEEELRKKRTTIKASNLFDLRAKLFRFAQQRGFESGLIYTLLDEIL
jgi:regulatory protein